jgi:hypothetical protein
VTSFVSFLLFYWDKYNHTIFFLCVQNVWWVEIGHHFESFTVATTTWLTAKAYLCHKWPRICSTDMGPFNGKTRILKLPGTILITEYLTLTLTLALTLNILLFTHLYLWFYSIVIILKHGQICKHASDGRIILFLCKVGHVCGTESDMFGRVWHHNGIRLVFGFSSWYLTS